MKKVVQLNDEGYFIGITNVEESPLEPGVFLIPAGALEISEPIIPEGQKAKWNGKWVFEDIPQPPAPPAPVEPTYADKRAAEYPDYRDYLDGIVKGNQSQIEMYISACLAVKEKYPKK
jgi:hypothetical protein